MHLPATHGVKLKEHSELKAQLKTELKAKLKTELTTARPQAKGRLYSVSVARH